MADLAHAAAFDSDLIGDTDAVHWAERFVHHARRWHADGATADVPMVCLDEGAMLTWFAGCIESGRGAARPSEVTVRVADVAPVAGFIARVCRAEALSRKMTAADAAALPGPAAEAISELQSAVRDLGVAG